MPVDPMPFGDIDPEDGWSPADPIDEKIDRIARWAVSILLELAYDGPSPRVLYRAADCRIERYRAALARGLTPGQLAVLVLVNKALEEVR